MSRERCPHANRRYRCGLPENHQQLLCIPWCDRHGEWAAECACLCSCTVERPDPACAPFVGQEAVH